MLSKSIVISNNGDIFKVIRTSDLLLIRRVSRYRVLEKKVLSNDAKRVINKGYLFLVTEAEISASCQLDVRAIQECCGIFCKVQGKLLYRGLHDFNFPVYTVMMR